MHLHHQHDQNSKDSSIVSRLGPSEEIKASPEFQALHGYVSGHVSSLGSAQDKFCQSVEDKFMNTENPSDVEESLWRAWRAVTGVAAQTPFDSEQNHKLVTMVVNLQTRPKLEKNGNTCQISDAVVWKDLPLFGMQMRESWNFLPQDDSPEEAKQHWLNLNAFAAVLLSSSHGHQKTGPDFSLFGLWTIRTALEEHDRPSIISIEAAAVWFVSAAPPLFKLCKDEKSFDGKKARAGSRFQDKAWTGFSIERWRAWATAFSDFHGQGLSKRGEALVTQASRNMGQLLER